jgi:T5SS/PEP-CTERM-associated repeat protein
MVTAMYSLSIPEQFCRARLRRQDMRLMSIAIAFAILLVTTPASATTWLGGTGNWHTFGAWSNGLPNGFEHAEIRNNGTVNLVTQDGTSLDVRLGGANHTGTLNIGEPFDPFGVLLNSRDGHVGFDGGFGKVNIFANSQWDLSHTLSVGALGSGKLNILAGGFADSTDGGIAESTGVTGAVNVDGTNAWWRIENGLYLGNKGTGSLNIRNGGSVSDSGAQLGGFPGSIGTATVHGTNSKWTNGIVTVGLLGSGRINVQSGALVSSSTLVFAHEESAFGNAMVEGMNSRLSTTGEMRVGWKGNSNVTVRNGGKLSSIDATIGFSAGSSGVVNIDGEGSSWSSTAGTSFFVGMDGEGELNVIAGGDVSTGPAAVGAFDGVGRATINGFGSNWNSTRMFVGFLGDGTLQIENAGSVTSTHAVIGDSPGSQGIVVVDGDGSTWTSANEVIVAESGDAVLRLRNGGKLNNTFSYIGQLANSNGAVEVQGPNSKWTNSSSLVVAESGDGALLVESGGEVASANSYVGRLANSHGTATVSGISSNWNAGSELVVGDSGSGTLNILNGGAVTSPTAVIGWKAGGSGTTVVDGVASRWIVSNYLRIGEDGQGSLDVLNSAAVTANNTWIGLQGALRGNGSIDTTYLYSEGRIEPGDSLGTLEVNGDLALVATSTIQIEIASASSYDTLDVAGMLDAGGELEINFLNGYIPAVGHSFNVLDWGSRVREFDILTLPALPGAMSWNSTRLYTDGILAISSSTPSSGDFNRDGIVNAADYVAWRKTGGLAI